MANKYQIRKYLSGSREFVEISKKEYQKIKVAKDNLFQALFIEEKLDLVLENFFEFENSLLNTGLKNMIFRQQNYIWLQAEKRIISRKLINLLAASALYLDHIIHHLSNIYGKSSHQFLELKKLFSEQYDEYLSYRVMSALRNYVQHRGFPIHAISCHMTWVNSKSDRKMRFIVTPYILVSKLEDDEKFKKSVLMELKHLGEKNDIMPFLREYISCIGTIHGRIREILKAHISEWEATIQDAINRYKKKPGSNVNIVGLSALILTESEKMIERVGLFKDHIELRRELERKNTMLDSMPKRYVTSEFVNK